MRSTWLASAVCIATLASVGTSAQTTADRPSWTFGATAGGGRTWDDEGSIGGGWLAGGYADRRITRHVDVELSADVLRHDRATGPGFQAQGHTTYLTAALVRRFGSARSNIFVLGGGTIGIHRGTAGFGDEPVQANTNGTHPGYIFGGGFSFRVARNIEIAPNVRFTMLSIDVDSDPAMSYMLGVRVGF